MSDDVAAREMQLAIKLKTDRQAYARACLTIRDKNKAARPLIFNRAQQYIDEKLDAQKAATGKVRALILKGRQQGCSTYVAGRFYHQTTHEHGTKAFILTHEDPATQNLFNIVKRYHDNCPEVFRPSTGAANSKELVFDKLDSGYKVGTAGTKGTGRSATFQLFHGSEVAFWPHADTHIAGVLQAVPDAPGTEVILESTANGVGGTFHKMWRDAETGAGDFIAIFVPWYWQDEYRRPAPAGFVLDAEEQHLCGLYKLSLEQMAWRRAKIAELQDPALFMQEYPATAAEAFQNTGHDCYIPPALVAKARKATQEPSGPLVIGFDPALEGRRIAHSMAWRRGRSVIKVESRQGLDTMQCGRLAQTGDRRREADARLHRCRRRRRWRLRSPDRDGLWRHRAGRQFRLARRWSRRLSTNARQAERRPAQPPRGNVDEVEGMARGFGRRADPGQRQPAGRCLRTRLQVRQPHAPAARGQGPDARPRRAEPRRVGCGCAHLCRAGEFDAEQLQPRDRVSESLRRLG